MKMLLVQFQFFVVSYSSVIIIMNFQFFSHLTLAPPSLSSHCEMEVFRFIFLFTFGIAMEMWNQFSGNGRVIVASNCKFFHAELHSQRKKSWMKMNSFLLVNAHFFARIFRKCQQKNCWGKMWKSLCGALRIFGIWTMATSWRELEDEFQFHWEKKVATSTFPFFPAQKLRTLENAIYLSGEKSSRIEVFVFGQSENLLIPQKICQTSDGTIELTQQSEIVNFPPFFMLFPFN